MTKKIAIISISILVILIIAIIGIGIYLSLGKKPPVSPQENLPVTESFLFLRNKQIMLYSADGKISSSPARENITDFAYSQQDKIIYFLRDGDIWSQPLDSAISTAITNTKSHVVSLSLSPDFKNLAYITYGTPAAKLYSLNLKTQEIQPLLPNNLKMIISLPSWDNRGQLIIKQQSRTSTSGLEYLVLGSKPPIVKSGVGIVSWSSSGFYAEASRSAIISTSKQSQSTVTIYDPVGKLLSRKDNLPGLVQNFVWSADNKLVVVELPQALAWSWIDDINNWQEVNFAGDVFRTKIFPNGQIITTVVTMGSTNSQGSIYIVEPSTGKYEKISDNGVNPWPI